MARNSVLRLLVLGVLSVLPAFPAIVTYTDLGTWQAAVTPLGATVDFSNLAPTPGSYSSTMASIYYTDPGVTFTSTGGDSVQVNYASGSQPWYNWGTGAIIHPAWGNTGVMQVTLATAATAFATNMMIPNGASGSSMTVSVKSGATSLYTSSPALATSALPAPTFFGVVSTDPLVTFNLITFTPAVNSAQLDNVRVGSYNAAPPEPPPAGVPEPGAGLLVLSGAGLLALGWIRKR